MYELPHELPNDLKVRIFGNQEISENPLKCLDLMASTQPAIQKPNFDVFRAKNCKKSTVKHSIEKPILLTFVNLSTTFYPRLSDETDVYF